MDLISRQRFGDFDLSFEWRLPVGGNSGLLYRVTEEYPAAWQSGPEMQLVDNSVHPDGRVPETSCGALYGVYATESRSSCPAGLFNIGRVSMRGLPRRALAERRARACLRPPAQFARAADGHVVLQHHGTDAWFRNIRISSI